MVEIESKEVGEYKANLLHHYFNTLLRGSVHAVYKVISKYVPKYDENAPIQILALINTFNQLIEEERKDERYGHNAEFFAHLRDIFLTVIYYTRRYEKLFVRYAMIYLNEITVLEKRNEFDKEKW